jgi:hypothetical protein
MLIQIKIIFSFMDHIIWERGTSVCCWQYPKAPGTATNQYLHDCQQSDTIMAYRAHIPQINPPTTINHRQYRIHENKNRLQTSTLHNYHVMVHAFILGKSHPCQQEGTGMPSMPLVSMNLQRSSSPKTARYSIWISATIKKQWIHEALQYLRSYCHNCIVMYIHQN